MEMSYSRVEADVDLDAIRWNLKEMKQNMNPDAEVCAVVKADAYGHGAVPVARAIEDMVDWYAAATPEEGLSLRENGIKKPIMILGYSQQDIYERLIQEQIRPAIFKEEDAKAFSEAALRLHARGRIQIKLDCGMGRIGFLPGEASIKAIKRIFELPGIEIEGIFTHFSRADEADKGPVKKQLQCFLSMLDELLAEGVKLPICHCDNSAGIIDLPQANLNLARAGIAMYGLYPSSEVSTDRVKLKPALSLRSRISFLKTLPEGSAISYNATYVTDRETRVATIPVGYGDGYPRSLSNKGFVLIRGQKAPILGRVCMDQFMVDVSHIPGVCDGDEVTLIGRSEEAFLSVEEIAGLAGTFNYEFLCDLGKRIPRVYYQGGRIAGRKDYFNDVY